jgi:23S rRNA (guanosine2251-2'-O)-methyltransferase
MPDTLFIYGFHSVEAKIQSNPEQIIGIYLSDSRNDLRIENIKKLSEGLGLKQKKCTKNQLDKLSDGNLHHGVVAEIIMPTLPNHNQLIEHIKINNKPTFILILDSIQDPRNLGACLRSANAAGVDCVVINKNGSAPINSLVHKTSAGALNQLKIFQVTNLSRTIKALQSLNTWVIGLDGSANKSIYEIDLASSIAIVMGSEGRGLRNLTKKNCDQLVKIPMDGNVESLNVSVASGVALFEAKRQRN